MVKCPYCKQEFVLVDEGRLKGGRVRAAGATRCKCGALIRKGDKLCRRCAEVEALREIAAKAAVETTKSEGGER